MKKSICLIITLLMLFCGCSEDSQNVPTYADTTTVSTEPVTQGVSAEGVTIPSLVLYDSDIVFFRGDGLNLISGTGEEYKFLANEGFIYYIGELEYYGSVEGEDKTSQHMGVPYQPGLFSIKGDGDRNILLRYSDDSEWFSVYRKATLPEFDYSLENCSRIELVACPYNFGETFPHSTCGEGIADKTVIAEFASDIKSQQEPDEAGLYDLCKQDDGKLENCYVSHEIYGFFDEEPELMLRLHVTSYNDLAYSVLYNNQSYVLPNEWFQKLQNN